MDITSPGEDIAEAYRANEAYLFTSPISRQSLRTQLLSSCYVTPKGVERLSKLCKGQFHVRNYDHQNQDYSSTPRCTHRSTKLSNLPVHRTPPSKLQNVVVKNPFEESMRMNLDRPLVTPSIFTTVESPSQKSPEHFSWNIDDVANLHPAWINELQNQIEEPVDPEIERQAQEKIDRFFASNLNLESPWTVGEPLSRIAWAGHEASTPVKSPKAISMSFLEEPEELTAGEGPPMEDAWTQTELSLPSAIPIAVNTTIEKYCNSLMECEDFKPFSPRWRPGTSALSEDHRPSTPLRNSLFSSTVNPAGTSYRTPVLRVSRTSGTPMHLCSNMLSPIGVSPIVNDITQSRRYHESPSYWHSYTEGIESDSGAHTWSQTNLSLLRTVPSHVEAALKPYHTFTQDQSEGGETSSLNSSLIRRRKLFHDDHMNMNTNSFDMDSLTML